MTKQIKEKKKVLVLGSGFAGVYSYLDLLRHDKLCKCLEVTVVNKDDSFNFVVLAHEVATGGLLPANSSQPIQELPRDDDTDFMQAEVLSVDLDKQEVVVKQRNNVCDTCSLHEHGQILKYDYIVFALGSEAFWFGVPGVPEYALTLKTMQDAKKIKNKILESFEAAQYCADPDMQKEILNFVVVGGGPTGIELAGEMSDFMRGSIARVYPDLISKTNITLVQSGNKLVPQVDEWFHKKVEKILKEKQVEILFDHRVSEIKANKVITQHGEIMTRNVFWTAGVKAREVDITAKCGVNLDEKSKRIKVDEFLQIPTYSNAFVAGDQSYILNKETGQPYPMRAQFAVRQGKLVAKNIVADIHLKGQKEFFWKDQGFIVSLGRGGALAEIFGIKFSGPFAWWLYRTAYLLKLVGTKAKLRTGLEWAISLLFSRDISKLS